MSNRGPLPRFVGVAPSPKAADQVLPFSSISELLVGLFLNWAEFVRHIAYEPRQVVFDATEVLPGVTGWPDFEIVLDGGELEFVNAKYSEAAMRDQEREQLQRFDAHCHARGHRHRIIFREVLERDGFIETIALLRPYGSLTFRDEDIAGAVSILGGLPPTHLEGWEARARDALLPLDLVYHLLYHERIPLRFRPLVHRSLRQCRE